MLEGSRGQEILVFQRGKQVLSWLVHLGEGGFRRGSIKFEKEGPVPHSEGDETADVQTFHACETKYPIGGFCFPTSHLCV